jgi:hypothetical protein
MEVEWKENEDVAGDLSTTKDESMRSDDVLKEESRSENAGL